MYGREPGAQTETQVETPKYLYKVISVEEWGASQGKEVVDLSDADSTFIHLAREDQLDMVIKNFWGTTPVYVVLRIDTEKVTGKMVFEANPGSDNKYYHLYDCSIPLEPLSRLK